MPHLNKRSVLIIGGGVALVMLVMFLRSRGSSGGGNASVPTDTMGTTASPTASDYANMSGDLQQVAANETSDIMKLQGDMSAAAGVESADIASVSSQIAGLEAQGGIVGPEGPAGPAGMVTVVNAAAGSARQPPQARPVSRQQPRKVGKSKVVTPHAHTNQHHPAGTAGSAVAQRSHGTHTAAAATQATRVGNHPATVTHLHPYNAPAPVHTSSPPHATVTHPLPARPAPHPAPPPRRPVRRGP